MPLPAIETHKPVYWIRGAIPNVSLYMHGVFRQAAGGTGKHVSGKSHQYSKALHYNGAVAFIVARGYFGYGLDQREATLQANGDLH